MTQKDVDSPDTLRECRRMSTLIDHLQKRIASRPKSVSMREIGRRAKVGEASVRRLRAGQPVTVAVYERVKSAMDEIESARNETAA